MGTIFLRCSRCQIRHCCAKECQVDDWKKGGHKKDCQPAQQQQQQSLVRYEDHDWTKKSRTHSPIQSLLFPTLEVFLPKPLQKDVDKG